MTGWDWFDPDAATPADTAQDHWQTCFASDAGQKVLRDLETQFVRTSLGPDAGQAALWMREGAVRGSRPTSSIFRKPHKRRTGMTHIPAQETASEVTTETSTAPETPAQTGPLVDFGLDQTPAPDVTPAAPEDVEHNPAIIPENPDGYAITVDDGLGGADPALNARLHAAGFNQGQAQLVYDLAGEIITPMIAEIEQAGQRASDRAALIAEFGGAESWKSLAPKIEKWGRDNLPDAAFDTLCQTASGVKALHRLMTGGGEARLAGGDGTDQNGDIRAELRRKMNDPRYWRDRDPALVAEVQHGFARLTGE